MVLSTFFYFLFDPLISVKVDKMEGTKLKVLQTVKRYYQCVSAICYLVMTISEYESKLKGPDKQYKERVKTTESVQRMYFLGSGL